MADNRNDKGLDLGKLPVFALRFRRRHGVRIWRRLGTPVW